MIRQDHYGHFSRVSKQNYQVVGSLRSGKASDVTLSYMLYGCKLG